MVQPKDLFRGFGTNEDRQLFRLVRICVFISLIFLLLAVVACDKTLPAEITRVPVTEVPKEEVPEEAKAADESPQDNNEGSAGTESVEDNNEEIEMVEGVVPKPTITPEVEKEIVICLGGEPISLFPYGDDSIAAFGLRHAVYENLFTTIGYDYQAQGLDKLPSLTDDDAALKTIIVDEGDKVKDINGNVVTLVKDVTVLNSDDEQVKFDGTPIEMEQMVVDFTFQPMYWSDGTPVTAQDSIFSYQLASNPKIVIGKERLTATERYEAIDERSTRWTGIPGHFDQTYFLNVWQPLPSHQLSEMDVDELKTSEVTNKTPLGNGPYVATDWTSDDELILVRNEHYYRKEEGFPIIDRIIVRFGDGEEFLAGDPEDACDVISNGAIRTGNLPLLEMAAEKGQWRVITSPGSVFEHIAFGINPVSEYADRRPDWFEDNQVRQAIAMCTDRQRMVDELTDGRAELLHAYVAENHKLFPDDLKMWPYDPEQANELLDEAGYLDFSEDGRRQDVSSGIPMTITLGTNSESSLRLHITEIFQENLADCGIPVETYDYPAGTWFAEGPVGRIFGRRFDLAQFAWIGKSVPDCGLYLSENIPGPADAGFGGWQNTNITGWTNEEFDLACLAAMEAMPGGEDYDKNQREALRIFAEDMPVIPLFTNIKVAAVRPWMTNITLDPSQSSLLWNIYEWDIER